MNLDANQINGVVRAVLPAILAYAVAKGWITQSSVGDVSAAVVAVAMAAWSVASNKTKA
jgi:hypothetical protein